MSSRTSSSHSAQLRKVVKNLFYCPAYPIWRLPSDHTIPLSGRRFGSSLVSATAVHASKFIPSRNRDLHQALIELGKKASGQVNLSRLQLAIQGLESERPTARIAFLGLDVPAAARRLVRLLLADSSKPPQDWEARLLAEDLARSQGVVVRFGSFRNEALQSPRSTLPVILIPAPVLRNQGLEILISSVNSQDQTKKSGGDTPSDVLLSPAIGTPASADGRQSLINQPVHRATIVAHGVDELLNVAEILARTKFESKIERTLVDVVLHLRGGIGSSASKTITVDLAGAEQGLNAVREDLGKARDYEKTWTESGMPAVSKLLTSSAPRSSAGLLPLLRDLIACLLESTAASIVSQAEEAKILARSKAMANETSLSLENAINTFSQQGHAELQSGLAAAWSSRNWSKLAFWKLFWRVDDVPLIVTDLVTTAWLPRTERAVYELTGRMKQANVSISSRAPTSFPAPDVYAIPVQANIGEPASDRVSNRLILAPTASPESVSSPLLPPTRTTSKTSPIPYRAPSLTSIISVSRQTFMATAIIALTFSAQQIVLKALTVTSVSAALSALSFFSVTNGSVYESATVFALGTAYALRRMQREWEAQCKDLETGLLDEGRSVLKQTEEHMRRLVDDASQVVEDEVEVRARTEAIEAVEKVKAALAKHV